MPAASGAAFQWHRKSRLQTAAEQEAAPEKAADSGAGTGEGAGVSAENTLSAPNRFGLRRYRFAENAPTPKLPARHRPVGSAVSGSPAAVPPPPLSDPTRVVPLAAAPVSAIGALPPSPEQATARASLRAAIGAPVLAATGRLAPTAPVESETVGELKRTLSERPADYSDIE
jgi:hypothetical protein